jgi:hypothetical protein
MFPNVFDILLYEIVAVAGGTRARVEHPSVKRCAQIERAVFVTNVARHWGRQHQIPAYKRERGSVAGIHPEINSAEINQPV